MPLKNSMVAELPKIKITSTADITGTGVTEEVTINPLDVTSSPRISRSIHPSTGETTDHRALSHLDYESSGHTGFASSADLQTALLSQVDLEGSSGFVPAEDLKKIKDNLSTKIQLNGTILTLSAKAGKNWTYTSALDQETGDMTILTLDTTTGAYGSQVKNPARDQMNAHIEDKTVHLQAGERTTWNNKVTAEVNVGEQTLILER